MHTVSFDSDPAYQRTFSVQRRATGARHTRRRQARASAGSQTSATRSGRGRWCLSLRTACLTTLQHSSSAETGAITKALLGVTKSGRDLHNGRPHPPGVWSEHLVLLAAETSAISRGCACPARTQVHTRLSCLAITKLACKD